MDKNLSLEGFDSVWQRVTELSSNTDTATAQNSATREQAVCLVKQSSQSCAVRFIPET